ncbi:hypothetical protein L615_002300000360 [Nocardioides sp. J9]|uniref:hypothetical protein n=1 Tax=Nocardioides sp. J9 TaxID=935844 RepID=UPI0011A645D7|nr:hypothetical protein [Nocardioides sp. J9]TWG99998.1 hypothetical protein L615_002300000360 [Nocardioides sp. J9]
MSTSSAENPVLGVVTFTARGNAALDQLADALVAESDGSPTSIADLLEQVLEAEIEDLAESLSQSAQPAPPASLDVDELGPRPRAPTALRVGGSRRGRCAQAATSAYPGTGTPRDGRGLKSLKAAKARGDI